MKTKRVYLDYATTTPLDPLVERAMKPFARNTSGNPESLHREGVAALGALEEFRTSVARLLQAHKNEIIFTSGGTESNNLALLGFSAALEKQGVPYNQMHFIISNVEHSSVRECAFELKRRGASVSWLPVDLEGIVSVSELEKLITEHTVLVSVMHANNEIGTVQPIERIGAYIKKLNERRSLPIRFHTDACQSFLYLPVNQNRFGADFISLDGHKLYGPKGVGALYARNRAPLEPIIFGGGQEKGKRPGTQALALIAGFSKALESAAKWREKENRRLSLLRDFFIREILKIKGVLLNGSSSLRLPNNVNISVPNLDAEFAVLQLDALGVACSAKSACLENERESYVVKALGRNDKSERSSLRFTLGIATTKKDITLALHALKTVLKRQKISSNQA